MKGKIGVVLVQKKSWEEALAPFPLSLDEDSSRNKGNGITMAAELCYEERKHYRQKGARCEERTTNVRRYTKLCRAKERHEAQNANKERERRSRHGLSKKKVRRAPTKNPTSNQYPSKGTMSSVVRTLEPKVIAQQFAKHVRSCMWPSRKRCVWCGSTLYSSTFIL